MSKYEVERLGSDTMGFLTLQRILETPNPAYRLVQVFILNRDLIAVWEVHDVVAG